MRRAEFRQQWAPQDTNHGQSPCSVTARRDPAQVSNLPLEDGKSRSANPHRLMSKRVPGRQVILKTKILNGKEESQTKKLDFSLHIYNIQIFNTLFQRWLQSMGLERW